MSSVVCACILGEPLLRYVRLMSSQFHLSSVACDVGAFCSVELFGNICAPSNSFGIGPFALKCRKKFKGVLVDSRYFVQLVIVLANLSK